MSEKLIIVLLLVGGVLVWAVLAYNQLVALRNRFQNAFAQIDVQLKRRYELIPNLVESAKAYMAHERGALQEVIAARNSADAARQSASARPENVQAVRALSQAESAMGATLGRFMALAEAYPDLKANQTIGDLMEELASTENRVGFARQAFNDAVMFYNTACQSFPSNLIAKRYAFGPAELLQIDNPEERKAVRVAF
jgi:LemA protein